MIDSPWKVVPVLKWPAALTPDRDRKRSPFSAGWSTSKGYGGESTLELLAKELRELDAENVRLQMAVTPEEIRLDGKPRANARPSHPGVILTFESKHGPLQYPCDTFDDWQANVRAIGLSLRALRAVDRYGVTRHGEQYVGSKALPPAGGSSVTMDTGEAALVLARAANPPSEDDDEWIHEEAERIQRYPAAWTSAMRVAVKKTHPDVGGDVADFHRVQEAGKVLGAHHGARR